MIRIHQTTFDAPGGNCLSACVASIMHVSLLEVPHFGGDHEWWGNLNAWLSGRWMYALNAKLDAAPGAWRPEGYYILAGRSPRGPWLHAVVARGRDVVWDPHPSHDGILSHDDATVLVPLDPSIHERAWRDQKR